MMTRRRVSGHCKRFVIGLAIIVTVFLVVVLHSENSLDTATSRYTLLRGRLKSVAHVSVNYQVSKYTQVIVLIAEMVKDVNS